MSKDIQGASPVGDRATDAPHGAPAGLRPAGSVSTSAGHTPLPWSLHPEHTGELIGDDETLIALLVGSEQSHQTWRIDPSLARLGHYPERCANAAFIVRACNSHYELRDALDSLIGVLEGIASGDGLTPPEQALLDDARETLAKARGQ